METPQMIIVIAFFVFVIAIFGIELWDVKKENKKLKSWKSKGLADIKKKNQTIENYKAQQPRFSKWMTKEQIKDIKGWSDSQFNTMMWALRKEGYAKSNEGKGKDLRYAIICRN